MSLGSEKQDSVHMVDPETGWTQSGNSTSVETAIRIPRGGGVIAFGIGASEFEHVFAIQYLWQVKLKKILVEFTGLYQKGGYSKEFILTLLPSTELLVVLAIWLKIGGELLMHPRWES